MAPGAILRQSANANGMENSLPVTTQHSLGRRAQRQRPFRGTTSRIASAIDPIDLDGAVHRLPMSEQVEALYRLSDSIRAEAKTLR
jgi:hypothetical protein